MDKVFMMNLDQNEFEIIGLKYVMNSLKLVNHLKLFRS